MKVFAAIWTWLNDPTPFDLPGCGWAGHDSAMPHGGYPRGSAILDQPTRRPAGSAQPVMAMEAQA